VCIDAHRDFAVDVLVVCVATNDECNNAHYNAANDTACYCTVRFLVRVRDAHIININVFNQPAAITATSGNDDDDDDDDGAASTPPSTLVDGSGEGDGASSCGHAHRPRVGG
jgi:hypothetical protein